MNFNRCIFFILSLLSLQALSAEELIKVYRMEPTGKLSTTDYYLRKVIDIKNDRYKVQDFYTSGNPKTLPYILLDKADLSKDPVESIDGSRTDCDLAGNKFGTIYYNKGVVNGLVIVWYGNGVKKIETYQYSDKFNGPFTVWYPNGTKKISGAFSSGKQIGIWTYWDKEGNKESEIFWKKPGEKFKTIKFDKQGNILE